MSLSRQRVTLITLGVAYLARAEEFYAAWGWRRHVSSQAGIVFYQMNGAVLALFGREDLARDQGRPGADLGTGAMTLAQNYPDKAQTDAAFQAALDAGATCLKTPQPVFWGDTPAISPIPTAMSGRSRPIPSGRWTVTAA